MNTITNYILAVFCIVVAIATALFGITIPQIWSQSQSIGEMRSDIRTISRDIENANQTLRAETKEIKDMLTEVDTNIESIRGRMADLDRDPQRFLAATGFVDMQSMSLVFVGGAGEAYYFAKDAETFKSLEGFGLEKVQVSPGIFGFVAPEEYADMFRGSSMIETTGGMDQ